MKQACIGYSACLALGYSLFCQGLRMQGMCRCHLVGSFGQHVWLCTNWYHRIGFHLLQNNQGHLHVVRDDWALWRHNDHYNRPQWHWDGWCWIGCHLCPTPTPLQMDWSPMVLCQSLLASAEQEVLQPRLTRTAAVAFERNIESSWTNIATATARGTKPACR